MKSLPVIGITMGDPAGIGPEIIIKTLSDDKLYDICRPVVFGDRGALYHFSRNNRKTSINEISGLSQVSGIPSIIDLFPISILHLQAQE